MTCFIGIVGVMCVGWWVGLVWGGGVSVGDNFHWKMWGKCYPSKELVKRKEET
jgi:hypothetical protein